MLNHRELAAFLAIARRGGINSAAQSVGLTQPALSRSLKRLEQTLGATLFDRHPDGMTLTGSGRALLRHAELVEFETARVLDELTTMDGPGAAIVRVGLVPSVVGSLFRRALVAVNRAAPDVQVRVIEGAGDQMLNAVANGAVDFALIGELREAAEPPVVTSVIGAEEVCIAARASHPVFDVREPTLDDLLEYRWALPEKGNAISFGFESLFRRNGLVPPTPVLSTNSVHTLKSVALEADYLTMMTRVVFSLEEAHGLMRPVLWPQTRLMRQVAAVRLDRRTLTPAAALLLTELELQAASSIRCRHPL